MHKWLLVINKATILIFNFVEKIPVFICLTIDLKNKKVLYVQINFNVVYYFDFLKNKSLIYG